MTIKLVALGDQAGRHTAAMFVELLVRFGEHPFAFLQGMLPLGHASFGDLELLQSAIDVESGRVDEAFSRLNTGCSHAQLALSGIQLFAAPLEIDAMLQVE